MFHFVTVVPKLQFRSEPREVSDLRHSLQACVDKEWNYHHQLITTIWLFNFCTRNLSSLKAVFSSVVDVLFKRKSAITFCHMAKKL